MTTKYYLLALANEIEGAPLRLYADAFRNSGAKIETQAARIAELEAALEGMTAWVAEWTDHVGDCSHKNETCSCGRAFNLHKARYALIEKPIMSSMSTKPMENINEQQD